MGSNVSATQVQQGRYKAHNFEYKWIIKDFKNLVKKNAIGSSISTEFLYCNLDKRNTCYLTLYPHGYNERVKNYVSIYLKRSETHEMLIEFTCAVLDCNGIKITHSKSIKQAMSFESTLGWMSYCSRDFILNNKEAILKDGDLILNCTFTIFEDSAIMNAEAEDDDPNMIKSLSKLSRDMNQLLREREFFDVVIEVNDEIFPVHKAILSARSAAFKRLMHDNCYQIHITGVNTEVMEKLLFYIYSGEVGYIDVQMAQDLYNAADKYELNDLKNICNNILVHNLDINNAVNILLLGHKYSSNDLINTTIEFIVKNATEIQEKEEWKLLMRNNTELANTVVRHILENR